MKRTPLVVFTGIATAAVGALAIMIYEGWQLPKMVAENPPAATAEQPVTPEGATPSAPVAPATPDASQFAQDTGTQQPAAAGTATPDASAAPQDQASATPDAQAPAAAEPAPAASAVPAFDTVRVEPTGEAVIAGHAAPGAKVVAKLNGQVVGEAQANADGSFAIVPDKPLPPGNGALSLEVNDNGKVVASEQSVVVAVKENTPPLVAKVDPAQPTQVTQAPAASNEPIPATVQLNAVDYDDAGNIVFSGRAAPGAVVRFYVDNALAGETQAGKDGTWSFKGGAAVTPGTHTLRADAIDAGGNVVSRVELPFLREDAKAVAAAQAPAQPAAQSAASQPATGEAPAAAAAAQPAPGQQASVQAVEEVPLSIVIQPGNNLWRISRSIYGKGRMFTIIYEANRDQVRNPNRIYPGQILTAPKLRN